jgi:hypothetical protein
MLFLSHTTLVIPANIDYDYLKEMLNRSAHKEVFTWHGMKKRYFTTFIPWD